MPSNNTTLITLPSINICKRIFHLLTILTISFSINVSTQAQEHREELILLQDIYSALSSHTINNTPFLHGLPNDVFYQLSQNIGMNNVVINYFGHMEEINNIDDMDVFYAAHIHDESGASLRLAFNSNVQTVVIDFGDAVIHVEPSSAYVALRDFNTLFAIYDFGGDIGLKSEGFDIFFPYSAFFAPVITQGLNYVITDENIFIENLDVHINGWNYVIGTPDDDTFLFQGFPATNTSTIDGGGGEDIIAFTPIDDINNDEPTESNENSHAVTIGAPLPNTPIISSETTLDTGVININDWIIHMDENDALSNENSFNNDIIDAVIEITPEDNTIIVVDDSFTIIDSETTENTIPINTEAELTDSIPISTEPETIINIPESNLSEEHESTGGGSFNYLTLFYLAFFSFLQKRIK